MCGRFALEHKDDFDTRFQLGNHLDLNSKYDFFPGSETPVIVKENFNFLWLMKWGLIPFWAKDRSIGHHLFNARAESVTQKPSFKKSFLDKRCLIPASGFFESKKYIQIKDQPYFSLAGLYDIWVDPVSGIENYTYTIITTEPNSAIKPFHHRMPVIFNQAKESIWLNPSTPVSSLQSLLKPYPSELTLIK
ncbi:MAG TPA: SOS response-associated peptidase [Candidatus Woesebacteria bacterium]|nr:SOS response-associated peptidase [Candidatus Woesebacteria bacterium]HPJ16673.1 SOS response-associated peptidase [Candidatus Woesebacteria bacterium]